MDTTSVEQNTDPIYQKIGRGYTQSRQADPRWQKQIRYAFEGARTLVNVGAGGGSYEPDDMDVVAVEPSQVMIDQRLPGSAPVVCAIAEQLPFPSGSFDAALAVLTTHHWHDAPAGLKEMRRVAASQVVVTWDPHVFAESFWLVRDYLPEIAAREADLATLNTVTDALHNPVVSVLPVPGDCLDGVLGAYWQRPEAYLCDAVRSAMSGIALTEPVAVERAMRRLESDIATGAWRTRYADLVELDALDIGYRLIVSG